ncbi:hypothetical protein N7510_006294 [Penicillium lagena]|uniref:uncharacterized protein n=1 Tax=Penicillium lagena TaxID=94218 RepID=UPI0025412CA8|nr:uncharacterized protein N7510_006294 [Penicillium lagena]KAJ5613100.1 hypothetical protein N7510_006294 [Penicillium lagena]
MPQASTSFEDHDAAQGFQPFRERQLLSYSLLQGTVSAMSFPPPHGHYPYVPPSYPPNGQHIPPQLLYNNVAPNPPSPYNAGYGKPGMYPQAMMPQYPAYPQQYNQQQFNQQPQLHHSPSQHLQQAPPRSPAQSFPQSQVPHHRPSSQQVPHAQLPSQSPRPPPPQSPVRHPPPGPRPPPPQQEELHQQFVNPAQLFVQPPLPTAPRSRYTQISLQYNEPPIPPAATVTPQPQPFPTTSPALSQTPAPPIARPPSATITSNNEDRSQQANANALQPSPIIKAELAPKPSPNVELKKAPPVPSPSPKIAPQIVAAEKPTKPTKPPVDYQVLLLSLADEYLNAAHNYGTKAALATREADVEEYYKLVATGLGCLEAVLKNWRLQPRKEALVRLRYARILFEETDNDIEAETALSKGIDLCERNRMLDLKYSMQHLLARMLHKKNPKTSLKAVDGMIQDVEAYRHAAWEYAFRFLRVTLSLSSPAHQDFVQALQHLHKIAAMASRNGDKAVSAMAAVIEALAHLQQGTSSDSIEQAQRAVAVARSHQLNDELRHVPQLTTIVQMVDICCSLLEYDVNQSAQKLKAMQTLMDEALSDTTNWSSDGSFSIPLSGKSAGPSSMDTGDILQVHNGTLLLSFNWLPQHDLYTLCYFISSITLSAKNSYDGRKAEKYLDEGLRMVQGGFKVPQEISESMVTANRRVEWRQALHCNFLLQRIFLACARTDWDLASQTLNNLRQLAHELGTRLPDNVECLMEYAAGTIAQATGDIKAALAIFQSPSLSLSPSFSKTARNDPRRDAGILAALNTVLIIRDPTHPSHHHLPNVLSTLESFCQGSSNKYIQAAYYLICATVHTDSTIQTKQFLQHALQSATAISNNQITCMTLTFMSWKYFRGVVGEQAEKSARAGRAMAKRANDRLWASVTDEMLAETLERQGKSEEAQNVREEGHRLTMGLPPALRRPA